MKKLFIIFLFFLLTQNAWASTKVIIQDSPPQIYPNQEFNVSFNIINDSISSDSYYVKGRIGSSSASLNKGETYNPITDSWFSDTLSWSNFPITKFNNETIATVSVKLRTNQAVFTGNNLLVIRVNKNGNYDSSPSAFLVSEPLLTETPIPTITPLEIETPTPTLTPTPQSYDNIYISEAMVNPLTGEKEWVEIYNNNDFSVSLNNWYVDDLENSGSSPKIFSLEIPAKNYNVFILTSSMFNNDGDNVRLLDFNKNLKDDLEYGKTETGKTLGRTLFDSDDFCLQEPSKNSINNSCISPSPTPTDVQTPNLGVSTIPTPTRNIIATKIPLKTGLINQTPTNFKITNPIFSTSPNVLGVSTKINNKNPLLINLLSFLSCFYSLLTITSILFKMKLGYGKNKNFYSPTFRSSRRK